MALAQRIDSEDLKWAVIAVSVQRQVGVLQEIQIGVSRADAFRQLDERTMVPELDGFVLSMIQADLFGVSIANVLRAQSKELRLKRRQRARGDRAEDPEAPVPDDLHVLPALFIIVLGPGAIHIYNQFFA